LFFEAESALTPTSGAANISTLERKTYMTTLKAISRCSSSDHPDFVSTDAAELASHMSHCARSRGRFFAVQTALDSAHSALSPRVVTVAALVAAISVLALA